MGDGNNENVTLKILKAKFIGSSKQVLDQNLATHATYIKMEF